jgi:hypothetical protein
MMAHLLDQGVSASTIFLSGELIGDHFLAHPSLTFTASPREPPSVIVYEVTDIANGIKTSNTPPIVSWIMLSS